MKRLGRVARRCHSDACCQFVLFVNRSFKRPPVLLLLAIFLFQLSTTRTHALPANIGRIFMIGFENHNFTQPTPTSSPQQIYANSAAPYINSLITPGNSNATYVSYCKRYYNTGNGVHPSEPNYIWQQAGSNLGILADNDPSTANGNLFTVEHFVHQLDMAGISWHNYEEDVEYTTPIVSKSGTRPSGTNAYNGSTQYNYACKHNPMCFCTNSWQRNVSSLTNFITDLHNNTVAQYNWLMPDIINCMHTATSANFTYRGTNYTGGTDQCAVAEGDNAVIIIRFDETEGGDTTNYTIPEIVISRLAKGNAYASSVVMSHSSDLKTMEEVYGLNFTNPAGAYYLSNSIASGATAATPAGTYNNIGGATVNDLGDLFAVQQTSAPPNLAITFPASNSVVIAWPNTGGYTLQQNSLPATTNWTPNSNTVTTANGTNTVAIDPLNGNLFFRLSQP